MMIEGLRDSISFYKTSKPVSGVLLDKSYVSLNNGLYREDVEYEKTQNVLGVGSVAGSVVVYRDIKTKKENALKTISLEAFRIEEIEAWIALAETRFPPALYLIRFEKNNVEIFMEKIAEGKTLLKIIDDDWKTIKDANLHIHFSFYFLDGILKAIVSMCNKQWVHGDLHAGNIMIEKDPISKLKIRILDFGKARSFAAGTQTSDYELFKSDIRQAIRIFSALYCGQQFYDDRSLVEPKRSEELKLVTLLDEQRDTLSCLIDCALETKRPEDLRKFQRNVDEKRTSEKVNEQIDDAMMDQFAELLFPGVKDVAAINGDPNENQEKESGDLDSYDTLDQMSRDLSSTRSFRPKTIKSRCSFV